MCSSHFLSGAPADLFNDTNPDWLPTINLGHKENCVCSFCHPKTTERHDRAQRRADKQSAVENEVRGILEKNELIDSSSIKIVVYC